MLLVAPAGHLACRARIVQSRHLAQKLGVRRRSGWSGEKCRLETQVQAFVADSDLNVAVRRHSRAVVEELAAAG
jgi:hypothetical protein